MKLKVFESNIDKEKETFLNFEKNPYGYIDVIAVDKNGDRIPFGHLIRFDTDGTVKFYSDVNKEIGFKLDSEGAIVFEGVI